METKYMKITVKIIASNPDTGEEFSQSVAGGLPKSHDHHVEYSIDAFGNRNSVIKDLAAKIALK